nr:tripartite tricarboxylate transporter substrate binding protein [Variovorax boronicumulans]
MKKTAIARRALCAGLLALVGTGAAAQADYPHAPITLIVPFPAGSVTDAQMRALAQEAGKRLGQPVVVLNRPGATGTLGPASMARTNKPDGYTISAIASSLTGLPHMQKVAYDPLKDFSYIVSVTGYSFALVVPANSPIQSLDDYVATARAQPGKLSYASSGIGGGTHLAMAQFAACSQIELNHITFKGGADATAAFLGGHVASQADGAWGALVDNGQARPLLVLTPNRLPQYPDVPTLKEKCPDAAVDGQVIGIAGPAGMPAEVVRRLHDAFKAAMAEPAFEQALRAAKQQPIYMGSQAYTDYMHKNFEDKRVLVKAIGLSIH